MSNGRFPQPSSVVHMIFSESYIPFSATFAFCPADADFPNSSGKNILPTPCVDGNILPSARVLQCHHLPPTEISKAQGSKPQKIVLCYLLECAQDQGQPRNSRQYSIFTIRTRGKAAVYCFDDIFRHFDGS